MKSIKVRFNLGKGPNYMKWKIQYPSGAVEYCDPATSHIILKGCTLKNNRKTAEKIMKSVNEAIEILQAFTQKLNEIQTVKKQLFEQDTTVYMLERSTIFHFEHCRHLEGKDNFRVFTCCRDCYKHKK